MLCSDTNQSGRMPVLEEARTIDYVTSHDMITSDHHGDEHFQNIKNGGRPRGNIEAKYSLSFRFHFAFISTFLRPIVGKDGIRIITVLVLEYLA